MNWDEPAVNRQEMPGCYCRAVATAGRPLLETA